MRSHYLCNTTIIEFYGLPGSGKSTIAKKVIKNIADCGYTVLDFNSYFSINKSNKKIIVTSLLSLHIKVFTLFFNYFKFIIKNDNKIVNIKRFLDFIRFYSILSKVTDRNDHDYIVVDQGFIQQIVSISNNNKIRDGKTIKKIIDKLLNNYDTIKFVNVDIDNIKCKERLKKRTNGTSTLDNVDANSLNYLIMVHRYNFKLINNLIPNNANLNIDSSKTSTINAEIICNYF